MVLLTAASFVERSPTSQSWHDTSVSSRRPDDRPPPSDNANNDWPHSCCMCRRRRLCLCGLCNQHNLADMSPQQATGNRQQAEQTTDSFECRGAHPTYLTTWQRRSRAAVPRGRSAQFADSERKSVSSFVSTVDALYCVFTDTVGLHLTKIGKLVHSHAWIFILVK